MSNHHPDSLDHHGSTTYGGDAGGSEEWSQTVFHPTFNPNDSALSKVSPLDSIPALSQPDRELSNYEKNVMPPALYDAIFRVKENTLQDTAES